MYSALQYFWLEDYLKFYCCHIWEGDEIAVRYFLSVLAVSLVQLAVFQALPCQLSCVNLCVTVQVEAMQVLVALHCIVQLFEQTGSSLESNMKTGCLSIHRYRAFLQLHCLCGGLILEVFSPCSSVLPFLCLVLLTATRESWSSCGRLLEFNTDAASEQKGFTLCYCCLIHSSIPKVRICSQGGRI